MGKSPRKKPRLPKANPKADEEPKSDTASIILSSDDEADDDLSLKIVEKAMLRACGNETDTNPSSSSKPEEITTEVKKRIRKRKEKMGARDNAVEEPKSDSAPIFLSSNDDANNDLSLKVVEKAMLSNETNSNPLASSSKPEEIVTEMKKKRKKRKERKKEKMEDNAVEDVEPKDSDVTLETNPAEKSDNIVLRKLLRGPRYFDPPDNNWGNCYNCGEGGHISANCTSAKRKKPCFVCGSFDHNVKQCNKGKDCFICKKGGHRAKDCPEKSIGGYQNARICLKCGDSGHEMFSCKSAYSPDDLKEIQCYVCMCFGHLCCVNNTNAGPREVSCYRCGQLGHNGWECARVHAETTSNGTPSSCYKCGQEGHLARKCTTTSTKKEKRKSEYSSPRKSRSQSRDNHVEARSVPHDLGNPRKKNKTQFGQSTSSQPIKRRSRGGWTTEDPGEWGSPPKFQDRYKSNDRFHTHNYNNNASGSGSGSGSGYISGYHSNGHGQKLHYESSNGSYHHQQSHRYAASRFGNSSNFGKRDYNTWDY